MNVKLVYGPAKSGKSRYVINNFVENIKKNPVLIVPSAENLRWIKRAILFETGLSGFCGYRILTFDNLVNILTEDAEELSHIGKVCLLRNIVSEGNVPLTLPARVGKGEGIELKYFQPIKDYDGFYEVLSAFISELKQGQLLPEDFLKGLQKKGLTDKDRELSAIYSVYQERLNKLNLYDHEGKFWQVQKLLEKGLSEPFSDCKLLLVDGFQNFSPTELKIIEAFGRFIDKVIITLTLEKDGAQGEFFVPTMKTYNRLKETFTGYEELALSESNGGEKNVHRHTNTIGVGVKIIACPGQTREVEEIAKEIKRLIIKCNKRPNEIVVLFRDLTDYKELIASEFRRYGIPYSISEGASLRNSPVVKCIMGLFEIILGNWSRESVFNFLKSNYVIYQPNMDVDKVGEVCRKAGIIEGKHMWMERLSPGPERDYISRFISIVEELEKESSPSVLRRLIGVFGIETQIGNCKESNLRKQEISAYTKFTEGLEDIENTESNNIRTFYKYLKMMIDTIEYPIEKVNTTSVQIMDVHRVRGLSFPVVFIGGLLEKGFPKQIQEGPFYSDRERIELRRFGINIEEAKDKQNEELFLFYMAVHTARDYLYLTYPATDNEGKEQLPSHYIDRIKEIVDTEIEGRTVHISDIIPQFDSIYTQDYLWSRVMLNFWRETEPGIGIALYNHLIKEKSPLYRQVVSNLFLNERKGGVITEKKSLEELARNYGKDYTFSISQFNEYGTCPFSYFCRRLLYLEPIEPPEEEITPINEGNLYHAILWDFYTGLREEKDGNTVITPDEVDEAISRMETVVEEHFQRVEREGLVNNMALWRIKKDEVIKNLRNVILYEAETNNSFRRPAYFEISFGMKKEPSTSLDSKSRKTSSFLRGKHLTGPTDKASVTRPLVIDTVKIRGKIDRIDIIEPNMFSVVDYKSGGTPIKLSDITSGTNIQLPVYILAIKNLILNDMEPFEGYFWHLKARKYFHANPLMHYKNNVLNPKWDNYMDTAIEYVKEYAQNIREGKFPVVPKGKCPSYCDYKDICRK